MGAAVIASDAVGFDTAGKVTPALARAAYDAGFRFVGRYVGLQLHTIGDLDAEEVAVIEASGLALLAIQHVRAPNWTPSGQLGAFDGTVALRNAQAAGYAEGAHLTVDLEGIRAFVRGQDVIDYVNAWALAVKSAYPAMLYVGYGVVLTPDELFHKLTVARYWSDYGDRAVTERGFTLKQVCGDVAFLGTRIDVDLLQADSLGGRPVWHAPAALITA